MKCPGVGRTAAGATSRLIQTPGGNLHIRGVDSVSPQEDRPAPEGTL